VTRVSQGAIELQRDIDLILVLVDVDDIDEAGGRLNTQRSWNRQRTRRPWSLCGCYAREEHRYEQGSLDTHGPSPCGRRPSAA
jgi:hypothetical protein